MQIRIIVSSLYDWSPLGILHEANLVSAESCLLANDLKEEGFTVVSLHPGWVRTDMKNAAQVLFLFLQ